MTDHPALLEIDIQIELFLTETIVSFRRFGKISTGDARVRQPPLTSNPDYLSASPEEPPRALELPYAKILQIGIVTLNLSK
jgi:hypothetical protein